MSTIFTKSEMSEARVELRPIECWLNSRCRHEAHFQGVLEGATVLACLVARGSEFQTAGATSENCRAAVARFGLISASLSRPSLELKQRSGTYGYGGIRVRKYDGSWSL
jgi:hypothetical protein